MGRTSILLMVVILFIGFQMPAQTGASIGGSSHSCPGGFFRTGSFGTECYKLFNDRYRDWNQAKEKCEAEKLILAHPLNPVPLRSHLVNVMGIDRWVHIGARGDNTAIRWLSNGQEISKFSPLWPPGQPTAASFSPNVGLNLMSSTEALLEIPNRPFFPAPVAWEQYTLCQSCPEGFFRTAGSHQCYKLYNDILRDWSQANEKCRAENLILAEPLNPVSVRSHLVEVLGIERWLHIGARGDGTAFRWLNNLQEIRSNSPLWAPGQPTATSVFTNVGLNLMSSSKSLQESPNQPFFPAPVAWNQYTLCQIPM